MKKSILNLNSEEINEIRDRVLNPLTVIKCQCEKNNSMNIDIDKEVVERQCSAILEYINSLSNK